MEEKRDASGVAITVQIKPWQLAQGKRKEERGLFGLGEISPSFFPRNQQRSRGKKLLKFEEEILHLQAIFAMIENMEIR